MADLREFQLAAVDRIVDRLRDPTGSRRFLLADEVGLGKTLVAKGVIEKLRSLKPRSGFTIIYVCSNSEIADQNRSKLCDDKSQAPPRLTLLALQSQEIAKRRDGGKLQVFAFTPGTSLQVKNGTGIAEERRLLLYLLSRIWNKPTEQSKWREFFRCSSFPDYWRERTRDSQLREEFFRRVSGDLQDRLKIQWESQKASPLPSGRATSISGCIDECVDSFAADSDNKCARKNRSLIIGELRKGLARVSLGFLDPNLIILDEFQRFSDILAESRDDKSIVGKLFAKRSSSVLILSATPYKMYTLDHEKENHHRDFLNTLAFLKNIGAGELSGTENDLRAFRERLEGGEWVKADDHLLFDLRDKIERGLREVMCRTERNWYLEDAAKGVKEITTEEACPKTSELLEYIHLRQFLLGHKVDEWNITDYWKSSSYALSFMDSHYRLITGIRRLKLPPTILPTSTELSRCAKDNAKFRMLFKKVFGGKGKESSRGAWKYLWVRPTYTYYKDNFYHDFEPTKFLIFSHWRFVPKSISVLTSMEAERYIGRTRRRLQSVPLQFRDKIAFYPMDACYPSPVLAAAVELLRTPTPRRGIATEKEIFVSAKQAMMQLLDKAGVRIGETRTVPLWRIVARLEARSPFRDSIRQAWENAQGKAFREVSEYLPKHIRQYLQWMDDDAPLSISPRWIDRLTHIALYSPAVSTLRSFRSVFPESAAEVWPEVLKLCLGPLRLYFNKRIVQTIIRRHGSGKSYTENILSYCRQAHFQAMLDEYAYLVFHVLQQKDPQEFLDHIGRAMGMWTGSPGINERTRGGHIDKRPKKQATHFALAFGDDVYNESVEETGKARKSAVREAFNSPFWPFVLATTSVGQEGLDFHLYCRDIVHWNLPSNPVDLEQREGRINRYDGLSIRRNIGKDFSLEVLDPGKGENLWRAVFRMLAEKEHGCGRFKHGLFPHWIYQKKDVRLTNDDPGQPIINRHLLFYATSRDCKSYTDLKSKLMLYRLVFGQPRQQDILDRVHLKGQGREPQELTRSLEKYMISLSPFTAAAAHARAKNEALRIHSMTEAVDELLREASAYSEKIPEPIRNELIGPLNELLSFVASKTASVDVKRRLCALEAILYLLDPYDAVHDRYGLLGYQDDAIVIRDAYAQVFASST